MEEKKIDVLTQLKRTSSAQPPRGIKFVERFFDDAANFHKPGLFRVPVQKTSQSTIKHARYIVDPDVLEQQVGQVMRHPQLRLYNAGSSCYANSACQALMSISSLRSLLFSDYYQRINSPVIRSLRQLQKTGEKGLESYLQTLSIFGLSPYNQSDATELFYKILEHLHSAECEAAGAELKDQTTAIDQLFSFVQQQEIECKRCNGLMTHQFLSRSCIVPVCHTLRKAFRSFLRGVAVSGYQCEFCGPNAEILNKQLIVQAARVFVVQLQRWNELGQKVNSNIKVPETLDLSGGVSAATVDFMQEGGGGGSSLAAQVLGSIRSCEKAHTHRLKAVVCHSGTSVHSGHYVAYVYSGGWQMRDDELQISCKFEHISFSEAVLLVYEEEARRAANLEVVVATEGAGAPEDFGERLPDDILVADPKSRGIEFNSSGGQNVPADPTNPDATVTAAATTQFAKDELLDTKALHSELLHAAPDEMDADIDKARKRKTQKDRDRNRAVRQEEIQQRRLAKYQKWKIRQKHGKFGTKIADAGKKGKQ